MNLTTILPFDAALTGTCLRRAIVVRRASNPQWCAVYMKRAAAGQEGQV